MNLPDAPIAHEGFFASHFFTVKDQEESKDFYARILGGAVDLKKGGRHSSVVRPPPGTMLPDTGLNRLYRLLQLVPRIERVHQRLVNFKRRGQVRQAQQLQHSRIHSRQLQLAST